MPHDSKPPTMSQRIFSLNLGVEAVSLYLLCCAVADAGAAITPTTLLEKWNGGREGLERELRNLTQRGILGSLPGSAGLEPRYCVMDEKDWR